MAKKRKRKADGVVALTLRNGFEISKNRMVKVSALVMGCWDTAGVLAGINDPKTMVLIGLAIAAVLCLALYVWGLKKAVSVSMSVKVKDSTVSLMKGDYEKNMDKVLRRLPPEEAGRCLFVIGMDRSGDLGISADKGILHDVLPYLNSTFRTAAGEKPQAAMQRVVDKAVAEETARQKSRGETVFPDRVLPYGLCVLIKLELVPNDGFAAAVPVRMMLVANSRKRYPGDPARADQVTDDDMSNIIVPAVFDQTPGLGCTRVMIGIMGTNGTRQPYPVIFSQIVNQFVRLRYRIGTADDVLELILSIRETDCRRWKITPAQLEAYLEACGGFYQPDGGTAA